MVREHARPLTLAEVARHSLTSTRHMQRVLADEGTSFRRMLLQVRMSHAARLLRTEAAVGEVARAVGYLELARFSKAFRCYYGCSPSTWRKGHR
jgi:AraC-like DNA-binding protein